jgi:hypothetical protein
MEIVKDKVKKHKITTEVYKRISEIAAGMVPCSKVINGKRQMKRVVKKCTWETMSPQNREHIEKHNPKDANKKGPYKEIWMEPVLINHKECLLAEYKMHGEDGITFYVETINKAIANENSSTDSGQE